MPKIYHFDSMPFFDWQKFKTGYKTNVIYYGSECYCTLIPYDNGWKFTIYSEANKAIIKYKFRQCTLQEAKDKAEYYSICD
jgi:hypothetical protein